MNLQGHESAAPVCGLAADVVRSFGEVRLRVSGTSMVPSILPGDLISVRRANLDEISTGEVVLYLRGDRLFAHRAVGCADVAGEPRLITRGDRLSYTDAPVAACELLGRVAFVERDGSPPLRVDATLRGWRHAVSRLLRGSDYATYFYVKCAALGRHLFSGRVSGRAACRA